MDYQTLPAMLAFIAVMVGTPGPNNLMLMASGANVGFRRSLPHIAGILAGCQVVLLAIGLGLGPLLARFPPLMLGLRVAGALFLMWLAWQLVRERPRQGRADPEADRARPLTFWQAALFQWINPKAWMMFLTAVASFTDPARFTPTMTALALGFLVVSAPLISAWSLFGVALRDWLYQGRRLAHFNRVMAALLLATLYPTFMT